MIPKFQTAIVFILSIFFTYITFSATSYAVDKPAVIDPDLKLEIVYQGNVTPGLRQLNQFTPVTQFAFLGNNDILVLSKNDGKVLRISSSDDILVETTFSNFLLFYFSWHIFISVYFYLLKACY
jgi:hypothetical protein